MSKELVPSFEGDLPQGWEIVTLGDIISPEGVFIDGDWVESKDQDPNGNVRLIQLADVADGFYKDKSARFLTKESALELKCTFLKKGDVLIARMPDPLGRACIFPGDEKECVTVVDVCVVRSGTEEISNKWIMYWVNSPRFRNTISSLQSGTTRRRISRGNLATITFPFPPPEQQKRIVAKIEELFSHIDAGIEALKKAKQLLKQYRQSVLKAAVTGKLTEQWRADRAAELDAQGSANAAGGTTPGAATKDETAKELLERILKERRQKWEEQQLEQFKAKGKIPKDDKWKGKYKESANFNEWNFLCELPKSWAWSSVAQIGDSKDQPVLTGPFGSNLGKKDFINTGVPVLTIGCLKEAGIVLTKAMHVSEEKADELERYKLKDGDMLFSRMAAVGRAGHINKELEGCLFNYHIMRLRLHNEAILQDYFVHYVRGSNQVYEYVKEVNHGATRDGINTQQLLEMPVALPPLNEQYQICLVVKEKLDSIRRLEIDIEHQLKKADKNKQSVLISAFSGKITNG